MGPRLRVDAETFLQKARESGNTVIRTNKVLLQGYTYIVRAGDYFYYTISKEPLDLRDLEVEVVQGALL